MTQGVNTLGAFHLNLRWHPPPLYAQSMQLIALRRHPCGLRCWCGSTSPLTREVLKWNGGANSWGMAHRYFKRAKIMQFSTSSAFGQIPGKASSPNKQNLKWINLLHFALHKRSIPGCDSYSDFVQVSHGSLGPQIFLGCSFNLFLQWPLPPKCCVLTVAFCTI